MSEANPRVRRYLATGIVYLALVASVFGFNIIRHKPRPPRRRRQRRREANWHRPYFG